MALEEFSPSTIISIRKDLAEDIAMGDMKGIESNSRALGLSETEVSRLKTSSKEIQKQFGTFWGQVRRIGDTTALAASLGLALGTAAHIQKAVVREHMEQSRIAAAEEAHTAEHRELDDKVAELNAELEAALKKLRPRKDIELFPKLAEEARLKRERDSQIKTLEARKELIPPKSKYVSSYQMTPEEVRRAALSFRPRITRIPGAKKELPRSMARGGLAGAAGLGVIGFLRASKKGKSKRAVKKTLGRVKKKKERRFR